MNNELLKRIEKLEQAVQDIWASCSCLRKDLGAVNIDMPNRECGELPEEPEEPESINEEPDDTIYCPEPTEEGENDHE